MLADVTCTVCGMTLAVQVVSNFHLSEGHVSNYYHIPNLNEHMQLHEGA